MRRSVRAAAALPGSLLLAAALAGCPNRAGSAPPPPPDPEPGLRAGIAAAPREVRPRLELIGYLLARGRRQDALDAAEEAHAAFPESLPVRAALAEAREGAGLPHEAAAALAPLEKLPRYRIRRAGVLIRAGRVPEGLRLLRTAPGLTDADRLAAAQAAMDARVPTEAVALLRPAARGGDPEARVTLGLAQLQAADYAAAAATLQDCAAQAPEQGAVRYYAGVALRLSGAAAAAEGHLAAAARVSPEEPLYHYELALCRVQQRNVAAARAALEAAAAAGPARPEVLRDLGRIRERSGDRVGALRARAAWLLLLDDPAAAVGALREARRTSGEPELIRELAAAEQAAGNYAAAVALLRGQRSAGPEARREALRAEVRLLRALQRYDDALAAAALLEAEAPADLEALADRADLLERQARYPEAEGLLRRLREREPENPYRPYRLGYALSLWYREPEKDREAEAELRRALEMRPGNPQALVALGGLLQRTGRAAEAVTHLRRALDADPTHRDALRLLALAAAQAGAPPAVGARARALLQRLRAADDEEARLRVPVNQRRGLPASRLLLARFYLRHGRLADAARELEVLVHHHPAEREAQALLAGLVGHARRFQRQLEARDAAGGRP